MPELPPTGIRSVIAGNNPARANPRYFRDWPRDPEGTRLFPLNLANRIEVAVGLQLPTDATARDQWEEAIAGVLTGLFTGMLHAPIYNATSPKHVGGRNGAATRITVAISALKAAADALENLPFTLSHRRPPLSLALLNREAAALLAQEVRATPRGRPQKTVQKRAVVELLSLYTLGFGAVPRRATGSSPFRRFVEEVWDIALKECGMNAKAIGTRDSAWSAAEHLLREQTSRRQKDAEKA